MKKYFAVFKMTLIENMQYVLNMALGFVSFIVMIFIFLNLWQYIYSDPNSLINGYTMKQMIWYVIITEMIWFGTRNKILINEISEDIKTGHIAYNLNKPYSYILYIISKYLGEIFIKVFIFITFAILTGIAFVGPIDNFNIVNIPYLIIVFILAIIINALIRVTISLFSFYIEESAPFHWIYDKLILIVGVLFPVEMFPKSMQGIIKWSPIFVVTYGPAKLIIDFSMNMLKEVLLVQIVYLIITSILITIVYRKGVKKLSVNGG